MVSPVFEHLLVRIRAEYREMPGLQLTLSQACRLWQIDAALCETVLQTLVERGFLIVRHDGRFITRSNPGMKFNAVKADSKMLELQRRA